MVDVDDWEVVLAVHLCLLEMILHLGTEVLRSGGEYGPVAEVLISTNQEHHVHELLFHPRHQWQLNTVPGAELQGQSLLGEDPHVLLELLLAEIRG